MGSANVDGLVDAADALSPDDRLTLLRRLISSYAASDLPHVDAYSSGYVVYATKDNTQECTSWLLAPGTNLSSTPFLAFAYMLGLIYVFLGIAIISDIFMAAIEVITAAEGTRRYRDADGRTVEYAYKRINPTVANLTLMALGSSAPEILLAIIGAIATLNDESPDELGPSTIVGSAAFNLLVISAICTSALPNGVQKKIQDPYVFAVTATFSIVAYIWLFIVLQVTSPNVVERWEAFVTFGLFGVMLFVAYLVDVRGRCCRVPTIVEPSDERGEPSFRHSHAGRRSSAALSSAGAGAVVVAAVGSRSDRRRSSTEDLMNELHRTRELHHARHMPADHGLAEVHPLTAYTPMHTGYMRGLTGQRRLQEHQAAHQPPGAAEQDAVAAGGKSDGLTSAGSAKSLGSLKEGGRSLPQHVASPSQLRQVGVVTSAPPSEPAPEPDASTVGFALPTYSVRAAWGEAVAVVRLDPPCAHRVIVTWRVQLAHDGGGDDADVAAQAERLASSVCAPGSGKLLIEPGLTSGMITVPIVEAAAPRRGRAHFSIILLGAHIEVAAGIIGTGGGPGAAAPALLSARAIATIAVVGAEAPDQPARGCVHFAEVAIVCEESCGSVTLQLERVGGVDGTLAVKFETCDGTARAGEDYEAANGGVVFVPGVTRAAVVIQIVDDDVEEEDETFTCHLSAVEPNTLLMGGNHVCTITILDDDSWQMRLRRSKAQLRSALASAFYATDKWSDKFTDAIELSGGVDEETGEELPPSIGDSVMHAVSLFWKLQFAFVPPESWGGGWPAFFASLFFLGVWTAVVGELASLFGCVCGLGDAITAITFVALGTSLPDTFASRLATLHDEYADAAIGNITGSNSVNVFLGLGIPWIIGSLYYRGNYVVPAGSLAFSIIVYSALAFLAICTLTARRILTGAELGGGRMGARVTSAFLTTLWLIYILLSSLYDKKQIPELQVQPS
ncbi:hypothetical protein KFE25_004143 [Diacronema lutheri]|uniref:Calx-beta domain-containing protein n=1 Tax=Diacronema lutheri TaxID=2081491 RepID=A0A8J6C025_DIALT|nr:hypothetical protein KFE25_004143 [Diacronema lutheri]